MRVRTKRWIAALLCIVLLLPVCAPAANAEEPEEKSGYAEPLDPTVDLTQTTYGQYIDAHGGSMDAFPDTVIDIPAAGFIGERDSSAFVTDYQGRENSLYWEQAGGSVTWTFRAAQSGWYQMAVTYCAIPGKNTDILLDVALDGEVPYANAQNVALKRLFLDETYFGMADNAFDVNLRGDELRPALVEQLDWQTQAIYDAKDQYPGPLYFYLEAGEHTLTLSLKESSVALYALQFRNDAQTPDYAQALSRWDGAGAKDTSGFLGEFEAEKSYLKNAVTLFATYDTAKVHVTPSSPTVVNYNTIGKNTWKDIGQEITWEFEVPEDGYYELAFKVKQYDKNNAYSVRAVTIDGDSPFTEMRIQKFAYNTGWYVQCLQSESGEPLKVYLTAGTHVLGMQATIDEEFARVLREADDVATELQGWYREIIKVTGFNADAERITIDANRDFDLDKNIPGLMAGLQSCKDRLEALYAEIEQLDGITTSSASTLKETATMLGQLIKRPKKIAQRIETFRSNISNLSTWAIDMRSQPLVMDKFYVFSPDMTAPKVGGGFFRQIWYRILMFFNSFSGAHTAVAGSTEVGESDVTLRVWISTADITTTGASSGRDQAIILKRLIDESFTTRTGINVEVSLVSGSDTLVQAVLAGEGPDAALFTSVDTPVNLAMRDVVLELSQFEGFEEVLTQFTESAVTPFWYKDGCYALPETQNFNVIFYRTDVFGELGLTPPETWEEFYDQVIRLSNENYMVGVPQNQNTFETFLYQSGTTFYTEDLSQSTFDTNEALTAFGNWTDMYTKYSLPLIFDFFNRFRSGEMAMAIMPYNQVNYLYSAAPELDGLWDIAPIPGTVDENGNLNNVETSSSTGCVGLRSTGHPKEVYEFLSWWVSAETQASFGVQVEQTLGVAARYATANKEAFEQLPWLSHQADVIRSQRENTVAVEQIPGSYYIARNLSFAFRAVVYSHANLRETLYKYNIEINKELERKQREFNY